MRRTHRLLAAGLAASAIVGACSANRSTTPTTAATTTTAPAPTTTTQPRVEPAECSEYAGEDAECGTVERLLDPASARLGAIDIAFERYPAIGSPTRGVIVAQEGGPGYSTTGSRDEFLALFDPLRDDHDVLFVDMRGTGGSGAINCPALQRGDGDYERDVGRCGQQLRGRSDVYNTAFAVDDLASVLDALEIDRIDLYGDSYGTFFAQAFAYRHPDRLRTLVLDAPYPVTGLDPWYPDTNAAIRDALRFVCERDPNCAARDRDLLETVAAGAARLSESPITGEAPNADGAVQQVTVTGVDVAGLVANATYGGPAYKELAAALDSALELDDPAPLLRLVSEANGPFPEDDPVDYSAGQYAAVICNDYPLLFDPHLREVAARERAFEQARDRLERSNPDVFAPFAFDDWLALDWIESRTCLRWPRPSRLVPPVELGTPAPDVPVLALAGDLDTITSFSGAEVASALFPNSTLVRVVNGFHAMGYGDRGHCASRLIVDFIESGGDAGDTGCAADYPEQRIVTRFARTAGDVVVPDGRDEEARRAGAIATATLGDAVGRWWSMYGEEGVGLRGGTFSVVGWDEIDFEFDDARWVDDVEVSGTMHWDRTTGDITADVTLTGEMVASLRIAWNALAPRATATVKGTLGDQPVAVIVAAP